MKKIFASLFASALLFALFGTAQASAEKPNEPGREHGLCTAYFNGQKKGHDKQDESPGPFAGLEQDAGDHDAGDENPEDDDGPDGVADNDDDTPGEESIASDVFEYCQQFGIGGQPEHNGRYDCISSEDDANNNGGRDRDNDTEIECVENTGDGDTGDDHPGNGNS